MSIKILHISDLHISSIGWRAHVDDKAQVPGLAQSVREDKTQTFLTKAGLARETLGHIDAIVVSGDVVNYGGTEHAEYDAAERFLSDLANTLGVDSKHVLVVPGNHDADWSSEPRLKERFARFSTAMSKFTTPRLGGGAPIDPMRFKSDDVTVDVLLLTSPVFSGVRQGKESLLKYVQNAFRAAGEDIAKKMATILERVDAPLDIAAIGHEQRQEILSTKARQDNRLHDLVRVAVLHHHLLPDPQLDISQFESVVDAGRVLDDLLDAGFDLVLSGHKHNRRWAKYSKEGSSLDVYSSPSLFERGEYSLPGFTVVEFFGGNQSCYATLGFFDTECVLQDLKDLIRDGCIDPHIQAAFAGIPRDVQTSSVVPFLGWTRKIASWSNEHLLQPLVSDLRASIDEDLKGLGDGVLHIHLPHFLHQWSALLKIVSELPEERKYFRAVSCSDIEFFVSGLAGSEVVRQYVVPIRDFKGEKHQILVIPQATMNDAFQSSQVARVVQEMLHDGIRVSIVFRSPKTEKGDGDFALVGDVARVRFIGDQSEGRSLEVATGAEVLEAARRDWTKILSEVTWDSTKDEPFFRWVERSSDNDSSPTEALALLAAGNLPFERATIMPSNRRRGRRESGTRLQSSASRRKEIWSSGRLPSDVSGKRMPTSGKYQMPRSN